ncbi:YiiD C-terminal domain-containing protein [Nocardia otitidiscaviarum]|uniref:YiiD C-terminal domain-containing protein n=1 Tax=Nocardia otitidiscaviarum TaxID=1823 RepID=UPI0004A6F561|nr:YiiD C-terminal domain-containing protein [Nocardia otitidiscaviarum]MBF6134890.1 YiiD C-terminal domain-containing protein [Nocardia otitidiscaviarum]MBF6485484.1 YiiD C-terminal domain-containing protein [Nocardia otitidiscaviarum]
MTTRTLSGFAAAYPELDPDAVDYGYLRAVSQAMVPFGRQVGTVVTEISAERAVVEIPAGDAVRNHMGTVHAGALFTAADIAGAAAFVGGAATRLHTIAQLVLRGGSAAYRKPALGRIRAVATVDPRELAEILAATESRRFELSGKAILLDDNDVTVAKFTFDYVCDVAIAGAEA